MTFEDTFPGDLVSITVHNNGKKLNLESKLVTVVDNCLVVEPFQMNDAIINFPNSVDIEMMVVHQTETPLYWQKVNVTTKLYHDKNHHVITSKLPGVKMNRRASFRVYIGQSVKLNGVKEDAINCTLRDISSTGFSVLVTKDINIELHKKIMAEYSDRSMNKYYELSGRPVRKLETGNYMCYGCVLDKRNPDLESYLTQKQLANRPNARKEF